MAIIPPRPDPNAWDTPTQISQAQDAANAWDKQYGAPATGTQLPVGQPYGGNGQQQPTAMPPTTPQFTLPTPTPVFRPPVQLYNPFGAQQQSQPMQQQPWQTSFQNPWQPQQAGQPSTKGFGKGPSNLQSPQQQNAAPQNTPTQPPNFRRLLQAGLYGRI